MDISELSAQDEHSVRESNHSQTCAYEYMLLTHYIFKNCSLLWFSSDLVFRLEFPSSNYIDALDISWQKYFYCKHYNYLFIYNYLYRQHVRSHLLELWHWIISLMCFGTSRHTYNANFKLMILIIIIYLFVIW